MTGMDDFRILKAADSALVFEFGTAIDRKISDRVLGLAEILNNAGLPWRHRDRGDVPFALRELRLANDHRGRAGAGHCSADEGRRDLLADPRLAGDSGLLCS